MVLAIILLKVKRGKVNEVGERLAAIDGFTEVFSVGGRYDLEAMFSIGTWLAYRVACRRNYQTYLM